MRIELLKWIIASSLGTVNAQYPHGYCYAPAAQLSGANELMQDGYVTAYPQSAQADGSFPVMATDKGIAAAKEAPTAQAAPQPQATAPQSVAPAATVRLDDNIPLPPAATRGFAPREGGSAVDRYGFANMAVNQSFHLPPSNDPDKAKATHRVFSSVVSQANAKLHPMHFVIREVGTTDPSGPGARVWRTEDLTGERPTRARKPKAAPQPAAEPAAPQGWPAPPAAAPQGGGFPAPGGFGAPAGFPAPQPAPQGFGGGFPENMPPAGFGTGGPSFGG